MRILRLTERGAALVAHLRRAETVDDLPASSQHLVARLVAMGALHPRPAPRPPSPAEVTVVVPAFDHDAGLDTTLTALAGTAAGLPVIVVDDGGPDTERTERIARAHGATVLRHARNRGPAAARNTGLAAVSTPVVVFLDAGCEPRLGWLEPLLALLDVEGVALAAPRIVGRDHGGGAVASYEAVRSSLDRGGEPGPVHPNSRIPYVPATCLAVRADAIRNAGGFDETLRVGEDVDLVWRLVESGLGARYEPAAQVAHDHRTDLIGLLRRRFDYGTSAAGLHRRHAGSVPALSVSAWSAAAWTALAAGHPLLATSVVGGSSAHLARRLRALEHPGVIAARLAGLGNLFAGRAIADALIRAWWPLTLLAARRSRRARLAALAAVTIPATVEWRRAGPALDLPRWLLLRLADDVAYATGVWEGCVRTRTAGPLLPDLSSWPGRRRRAAASDRELA